MEKSPSYGPLPFPEDLSKQGISIDTIETRKYNPILKKIESNLMRVYHGVMPTIVIINTDDFAIVPIRGNILGIPRGLLHLADNEAELAFVICHELMHYKRGDYTKTSYRIPRNITELNNTDIHNTELQADIGGAELYVQCGYPKRSIVDLLQKIENMNLHIADMEGEDLFESRKRILTAITNK